AAFSTSASAACQAINPSCSRPRTAPAATRGSPPATISHSSASCCCAAIAVCDAETMQLPDTLTLPLLGLGVLYRAADGFVGELHHGAAYARHSALLLGLRGSISAAATALALLL